ncbi:hypothetical protein BZZ01_21790 [Nostocales cyanobacterium HT-58-2]|nr:hypothetical protein BZZ01_21790 [Nostocales cyanobacterium HT-58-2]
MNGKYLTLIGTALTVALTSNVAVAQVAKFQQIAQSTSGQSSTPSKEIKLSPRVNKEKFCKDYPLNSLCTKASGTSGSGSTTETQTKPSDGGTAIPGKAPAEPGTLNTPGGTADVAPPPTGNPSTPSGETPTTPPESTPTTPGSEQKIQQDGTTGTPGTTAPSDSSVPGTAPVDPSTGGQSGSPTEVTPVPGGATTPGSSTDPTAPSSITDPTKSPTQSPSSDTQTTPSTGSLKK